MHTNDSASNPNVRRSLYYANIIFLCSLTVISLTFAMFVFFRPWVGKKSERKRIYSEGQIEEIKETSALKEREEIFSQMQSLLGSGDGATLALRKFFQDRIVAVLDGKYYFFPVSDRVDKNPFSPDAFSKKEDEIVYTAETPAVFITKGVYISDDNGRIDWDRLADSGLRDVMISAGSVTSERFVPDEQADRNCRKAVQKGFRAGLSVEMEEPASEEVLTEAAACAAELYLKHGSMTGTGSQEADIDTDIAGPEVLIRVKDREGGVPDESEKAQWTDTVSLLCEKIKANVGEPVIGMSFYSCGARLDMERVSGYRRWIIDYEKSPVFPYSFLFWEYEGDAHVHGVPGVCPLYVKVETGR